MSLPHHLPGIIRQKKHIFMFHDTIICIMISYSANYSIIMTPYVYTGQGVQLTLESVIRRERYHVTYQTTDDKHTVDM